MLRSREAELHLVFQGLRLRVWGLWFRFLVVKGLGFQDFRFGVWRVRFGVEG